MNKERDNWRMYAFDLGCLSSYEWRVTHALSHHLYTNTIIDYEMALVEPFVDFRVYDSKSFWYRSKLAFFFLLMISPLSLFTEVIKRIISISIGLEKLRPENLLPLLEIVFMWLMISPSPSTSATGINFSLPFKLWLMMQAACNFFFLANVLFMSHHHHEELYHLGDGAFRFGLDWGLAQLDATADSKETAGNLMVELCTFGNHIYHHLFPTLDHGILDFLQPVVQQTCRDFKLPQHFLQSPNIFNQKEFLTATIKQSARTKRRPPIQH